MRAGNPRLPRALRWLLLAAILVSLTVLVFLRSDWPLRLGVGVQPEATQRLEERFFRDIKVHEERLKNLGAIYQDFDRPAQEEINVPAPMRSSVTQQRLTSAGDQAQDWPLVNGSYSQDRYYPGSEINRESVGRLHLAFTADTGAIGAIEAAPLVVDGVMYVTAAFNNVYAFDALTGSLYWHYQYHNEFLGSCCGPVNRGLAVLDGKLFMATIDGHLVAIDAVSGRPLWTVKVIDDPSAGVYRCTGAPLAVDHKIILGCSASRGFVSAFDADTGHRVWNFFTIPDTGQEGVWATRDVTGHDLKRNIDEEKRLLASKQGSTSLGGNVWNTPSVDLATRTIFFVTADPLPMFSGKDHPGDNLYSDSIVALDLDTGKYRWHFQYIPHDIWDLDFAAPSMLGTALDEHGVKVPVVITAGKMGHVFVHRRDTGALLRYSEPMIPQRLWETDKESFDAMPNGVSGVIWSPMALDRQRNLAYALNVVMQDNNTGDVSPIAPYSNAFRFTGRLAAVDIDTGKLRWKFDTENPLVGGALATSGGLVFFGEGDGTIRALDAEIGKELWRFRCDAGANGVPIAYQVHGREFIAIGCGGHASYKFRRGSKFYVFSVEP